MENEQRYKEALMHVIYFIMEGESWKSLHAQRANDIAKMCKLVVYEDMTTEEAIVSITTNQ